PPFRERLKSYLVKAAREAKVHTGWLEPDTEYEDALKTFAASILEPGDKNKFLKDFTGFQRVISFYGAFNSLAQLLLKVASPGVPDFYQGTELWNFSLVDPDNRRPVDFGSRQELLAELIKEEAGDRRALAGKLADRWQDGRIKLYLTYRALRLRRDHRDLFAEGEYIPLDVSGPARKHTCAFARRLENKWALAAAPRLLASLQANRMRAAGAVSLSGLVPGETGGENPSHKLLPEEDVWAGSSLVLPEGAPGFWHNIFTGEETPVSTAASAGQDAIKGMSLPLAGVFRNFPVSLMTGELNH
ncbi:MAG: malto-oligosyltrehalose synthase, partial [Eubacteriales bacterium]